MGFEKLLDAIAEFWQSLLPWTVVDQTHAALVMRWGVYHRDLGPGFHWVIPFIENVETDDTRTRVESMNSQSLTTSDGLDVLVSVVLQWRINRFTESVLKIQEIEQAIPLACYGTVRSFIKRRSWAELEAADPDDLNNALKELCRKRVQKYGALVEEAEFCDMSRSKTHRWVRD